jgi:hypothetical protein
MNYFVVLSIFALVAALPLWLSAVELKFGIVTSFGAEPPRD